jgi:aquaporin Z
MGMDLCGRLREHWPEYLIEAGGIGAFMLSAIGFTALLEHPASPVHAALPDPFSRRALMGLAMAATAIGLVYSPWGQRSGAHFNPALTLTFLRLGKVEPADAGCYALAHFAGAAGGALLAGLALGALAADPAVRFAVTLPGHAGELAAFGAETAISGGLMLVVLLTSNAPRTARFTPLFVGACIATWITLEAPLSGMSMNPARTLGSAAGAGVFSSLWIYFTAPPLGMLLAAEAYLRLRGASAVRCAKLHHANAQRCIFRCGWSRPGRAQQTSLAAR